MVRLIDTHCHLDFSVFDKDRSAILQNCKNLSVQKIIVPGVQAKGWSNLLELCKQELMLYPALGLHPCFMQQHQPDELHRLEEYCQSGELYAIGEIGLDFRFGQACRSGQVSQQEALKKDQTGREQQLFYFSAQLQLAEQYVLPVLIHAVKSHQDVLARLKQHSSISGIIHAYSGSYEQAVEYLKLGFKLGFGGAYTYPRAKKLRALVSRLPLEAWVLETDAPDMSPESQYGQRNSPEYLPEIARVFVSLYDKPLAAEQILEQLYQNTLSILPKLKNGLKTGLKL